MNDEILSKLHRVAQIASNSYCRIRGIAFVVITGEDVELLCNPNLQIDSFNKTKHVPNLTRFLTEELKFQLSYYNTSQELEAIFAPHEFNRHYKAT